MTAISGLPALTAGAQAIEDAQLSAARTAALERLKTSPAARPSLSTRVLSRSWVARQVVRPKWALNRRRSRRQHDRVMALISSPEYKAEQARRRLVNEAQRGIK